MSQRPKYVGTEHPSMTALTLTILEYYSWKKSRSKSQIFRALLTAFPRVDPEFDFDELEWFAEKMVFPGLKKYPAAVDDLKADLKRFREREYTTHTSLLFDHGPPSKTETKTQEERTGSIKKKVESTVKKKTKSSKTSASLAEKVGKWGPGEDK